MVSRGKMALSATVSQGSPWIIPKSQDMDNL